MSSFRRSALLLALSMAAVIAASAQSSSSSSNPPASQPDQTQAQAGQSAGELSVQARIRARRAQRRAAAINEAYNHRYEAYTGMGYLRFTPGSALQRAHEYAWDVAATRYYNERLGVTVDGRGYFASAYVGGLLNPTNNAITNVKISQFAALAGPTYRFYMQPKYSVSGRVMAGVEHGNFSGDLAGRTPASFGLWPNATTFAASASAVGEYNISPRTSLRIAPEYYFTGFGSTVQYTPGFTIGLAFRFGKQ
jgi:hypothetical protein